MKITELIVTEELTDEGLGTFLGKTAGHIVGGLKAFGRDAKQGYRDAKSSWDSPAEPTGASTDVPAAGAAPATSTPAAQAPGSSSVFPSYYAPAAGGAEPTVSGTDTAAPAGDVNSIMKAIDSLDQNSKKQLAAELEKSMSKPAAEKPASTAPKTDATSAPAAGTAPPAAEPSTSDTLARIKADKDAKAAADAAERDKQIAATKAANAAASQADNELVAAVKAAKAKPAFQQTASDKLTIKQGAAKGIHEAKKKKKKQKLVLEFHSKFLNRVI